MKYIPKLVVFFVLAYSCSDEPVETLFFEFDTEQGVFIACEGNFMYGNGSLSFYDTHSRKVTNQVFYARNNAPLGDVVQSLARHGNSLFIVVNNSGKVVVADANTVEFKGAVTGLISPRYIHIVSDKKGYISDLHAKHITIFDPGTLEISGFIDTDGHSSEQMVQVGSYVYVSDWSYGNNLLVIDTETDKMIAEIEITLQPKDLAVDKNDKIWVLSDGSYEGSPSGNQVPAISRIDPETNTIEQIFRFSPGDVPSSIEFNREGDTLYFLNRNVYKMAIGSRHLPDSAFIWGGEKLFYNLAVDRSTNEIYVTDAIDYTQDAIVLRFAPEGALIDSFKTGINPSDFMFR